MTDLWYNSWQNSLLILCHLSIFFLTEKYDLVGKLLKPGEEPTHYSDEEEDLPNDASSKSVTNNTEKSKDEWRNYSGIDKIQHIQILRFV